MYSLDITQSLPNKQIKTKLLQRKIYLLQTTTTVTLQHATTLLLQFCKHI